MCDSAWKTGRPTKDGWYCIRIWLEHSEQFSDPTIWEWCRDKFISRHHLPVRFDYDVDQWCEIPLPSEKSTLQERLEEALDVIDDAIASLRTGTVSMGFKATPASNALFALESYRNKYSRTKGDSND